MGRGRNIAPMEGKRLDRVFYPDSVAVIGASRERGKIGHIVLENLLSGECDCSVHPVNPSADEVLGSRSYPTVLDVEGRVDLAVVVVPAPVVPGVLDECAEKGVAGAVVISGGFGEAGRDELSERIREIVEGSGIRVLGPNVLGTINTEIGLNASFASTMPDRGEIAFLTQSGALGGAIINWTATEDLGLSKVVSLGNKLDLDDADLIRYFSSKEEVEVISIYMEGLKDGRDFLKAAREVTPVTPVVAVKAGRSEAGERATASHTGSLAGRDEIFDAAFRQGGVIRARSASELFDMSEALTLQPPAPGKRVAVISNGGGAGVMATDACEERGLEVPELSDGLKSAIAEELPAIASPRNPVDTLGDSGFDRYAGVMRALTESGEVDGVIAIHVETSQIDPMGAARGIAAEATGEIPAVSCWIGGGGLEGARDVMRRRGIPHYPDPERACAGMKALVLQGDNREA